MEKHEPLQPPATQLQNFLISPIPTNDSIAEDLEDIATKEDASDDHEPLLGMQEETPNETKPATLQSKPYDPHLGDISPTESSATQTYDEEELKPEAPLPAKRTYSKQKQRHLDIIQRFTTLALSTIILGIMSHAHLTFLANKDVTVEGKSIYPSFMTLWPTYLMITSGAVTVVLNAFVLGWRIHGSFQDLHREEMYNKYWDYAMHGINGLIWLGTSTTFGVTKNWGDAEDPNVLWGYVCSTTASNLTETYPQILKFYVQCELQTVSFWTAVSSVMVEVFAVAAKLFVK